MPDFRDQSEFDVRCEWGMHGLTTLAPLAKLVVIIDLLSCASGRQLVEMGYRVDVETAT